MQSGIHVRSTRIHIHNIACESGISPGMSSLNGQACEAWSLHFCFCFYICWIFLLGVKQVLMINVFFLCNSCREGSISSIFRIIWHCMFTHVNLSAFHEFRIDMFCCVTMGVLHIAIMIIIIINDTTTITNYNNLTLQLLRQSPPNKKIYIYL